MTDMSHLSNVTIEMTSKELKRSCTELTEKITKRINQLKTAMDIHEVLDQVIQTGHQLEMTLFLPCNVYSRLASGALKEVIF